MPNYDGFPTTNPFTLVAGSVAPAAGSSPYWGPTGYQRPDPGAQRYGVPFGAGQHAQTSDPLAPGAGLWAYNFDPANPDTPYNLYTRIPENNQGQDAGRLQGFFQQYSTLAPADQYLNAYDAFYRDQLQRMTIDNSFGGELLGVLQDYIAPVALGALGGPGLAAAYGAVNQGALHDGGLLGAVTGGIGGYAAGSLGSSLATNGIAGTVNHALTGVTDFIQHPLDTLGSQLGGLGASAAGVAGDELGTLGPLGSTGGNVSLLSSLFGNGGLGSLVSAGANIVGSVIAGNAASDAASTQSAATTQAGNQTLQLGREQIAAQEKATAQARADVAPWRTAGLGALDKEKGLIGLDPAQTPEQIMALDPGYQFRKGEGERSIDQASAARRGPGLSGATLKELLRYGQDYASGEFQNVFSRVSGVSGAGLGAATGQAGFTQQGAQTAAAIGSNANTNAQNLFTSGAAANAAGTVGAANAWQSGLGNIGQQIMLQQLLSAKDAGNSATSLGI